MNYSRQRELIHRIVLENPIHPTADEVYALARAQETNISLGTVYRNLNLLSDMGEIIKISTPDGADRFDGRTVPHYHFFCTECGCMEDMNMACMKQIDQLANEAFDGIVESHSITFYGKCSRCLQKHSEAAAI